MIIDGREMTRKQFLELPFEERNGILREQTERMLEYYRNPENIVGGETDFHEYELEKD